MIAGTVLFALVAAWLMSRTSGIKQRVVPQVSESAIGPDQIINALPASEVARHLQALAPWPTRMPGSPGHEAAARHIRQSFEQLGLKVLVHPIRVTVPVTRYCQLLDLDSGRELEDLKLYPMWPNLVRTCTIPEPGLTATAVMGAQGGAYLYEFGGYEPQRTIPVVPMSTGEQWIGLADAGFPAVIFFQDVATRPRHYRRKELGFPANFPRFYLVGDPKQLDGRSVRLRCRVDWQTVQVDQIFGVLEPESATGQQDAEAVILTAHYDSISSTPDLAPGAEEACATAALLTTAKVAVAHRQHLKRTLVFVAMTGHGEAAWGVRRLAQLWGPPGDEAKVRQELTDRIDALEQRIDLLDAEHRMLTDEGDEGYWSIVGQDQQEAEQRYWVSSGLAGLHEALVEDLRRVIEAQVDRAQERLIESDLARLRSQDPHESPEAQAYRENRAVVEKLRFAATTDLLGLKTYHHLNVAHAWVKALGSHLKSKRRRLEADLARLSKSLGPQALLHRFDRYIVFCLAITSGAPNSAIFAEYPNSRHTTDGATGWLGPIAAELANDMRPLLPELAQVDPADRAAWLFAEAELFKDGVNPGGVSYPKSAMNAGSMNYELHFIYDYLQLLGEGRHAVAWFTPKDPSEQMGTPEDTFDRLNQEHLVVATRVIAAAVVRMGSGRVQLNATRHLPNTKSARGHVLQAADPNSVIPTRGVQGALVVARHRLARGIASVRQEDIDVTGEDGSFHFPPRDGIVGTPPKPPEDFQAFRLDPATGRIIAIKDQGEKGEGSYPTARRWNNFDNPLRLILFRCAQTDLFYPLHPSSSMPLGSAFSVDTRTHAAPDSFAVLSGNPFPIWRHPGQMAYEVLGQGFALFNPPAMRFYVGLRSASPLDPSLEATVAYLLGEPMGPAPEGKHVWGPGYLAHETPAIQLWPRHAARSMAAVDGHRLLRQQKHRVADPILVAQQEQAARFSALSSKHLAAQQHAESLHAAQDSLAISMEVYPRIGQTERDAVVGVLFYLFLVMPFAIFVERLVFGFPDIRMQLAGVVGIFAIVFVALRYLHPAFELVSSGLMVLLGFLTLAFSVLVTLFLLTRFKSNIKQLRLQLQRTAEAADVSRAAAAGTAFLLGINNMRKRKVRTAFTCITLVLVTFALLSLTAVRSGSRFKRIAVGHAPYTGILITEGPNGEPLQGTAALVERFGKRASVSPVYWASNTIGSAGYGGWGVSRGKPGESGTDRYPLFYVSNMVGMDPQEVEVTSVSEALVVGRWFVSPWERACLLPVNLARQLQISDQMAATGDTMVYIDGGGRKVVGLYEPKKLELVHDLNGQSLLPYDGTMINVDDRAAQQQQGLRSQIAMPKDMPRLPGDQVVLVPTQECSGMVSRLAVNLGQMPPGEAMQVITDFLKRWEGFIYYGIGGIAYYGRIYRGTFVEGLAQILIPLLIAGAIVLNTMLGSVYERSGEIGVYSAVGLSPTHVRYLFLAEACVYATVGAVAGYLVAHGIGSLLGALDLTGGLSFNYSTLATVYTTLVLVAAVLISTWYPAHKAARMASPSESMSIVMPPAQDDRMHVPMPFTYVELDAISVVPFLYDVLEDHGEGSSGKFFCEPPQIVSASQLPAEANGRGFGLRVRCWLRPYDLGVSQQVMVLISPTDVPNVWSAHLYLKRLSGDVDSWRRTNRLFLSELRRHFLAWRGLKEPQKDDYLVRGLAALDVSVQQFLARPTTVEAAS